MNIAVFNVKFSNNVGDGIVAETTEYLLSSLASESTISTFDLGGRNEYGDTGIKAPSTLKKTFSSVVKFLPVWLSDRLRQRVTYTLLKRDIIPRWREEIKKCDRLVIGGGHLISDAELYFPLRLHAIIKLAVELKKPIYLHAVGVSNPEHFSAMGRKLFLDIFKDNPYLHYVSVRDELSKKYWSSIFGGTVSVVPDPGNFTRETYFCFPSVDSTRGVVGVGVMASGLVVNDTPGNHTKVVLSVADYVALGKRLLDLGFTPLYFTNGSPEDESVLNDIKEKIFDMDRAIFAERPLVPEDLVKIICRCEKIIAYRLHACIVATSIGVPVIGLAWDKKLSSYFEGIGAEDRVCTSFDVDKVINQLVALEPVTVDFNKSAYMKLVS
ncbi:polysaccharide pyruvyl transferase family protein [Cellvibrio sp. NN19]|uniref:polysaccharide pyruvyl transferase family protein n=1 Tax=Cellvibrio chitinivorans TaxID=3102792 RepID=UPI002B40F6A4|nr:polysaccharide pyruvyl transferase family protein [Cellvibrio sp. NN19]